MSNNTTAPRLPIAHDSKLRYERWLYDPTYLIADDGKCSLFTRRIIGYTTRTGNFREKTVRDVEQFDSEDEMVAAIKGRDMMEVSDR